MEDNEIKSKYAAGENLYDEEGIPLKDSEYGSPDQVIGIEVQDEIEVHGIKYVRKYVQTIYNAVPASEMAKYLFKCGAPACNRYASSDNLNRNTELIRDDSEDRLFFTCANGHRNMLII